MHRNEGPPRSSWPQRGRSPPPTSLATQSCSSPSRASTCTFVPEPAKSDRSARLATAGVHRDSRHVTEGALGGVSGSEAHPLYVSKHRRPARGAPRPGSGMLCSSCGTSHEAQSFPDQRGATRSGSRLAVGSAGAARLSRGGYIQPTREVALVRAAKTEMITFIAMPKYAISAARCFDTGPGLLNTPCDLRCEMLRHRARWLLHPLACYIP